MRLTLEVISANGDALGSNRSKIIGPEGAQIGRSKESDWVINDPYISRVHARVRFTGGIYYVEGTGRNPLALNDPSNVVPNNQPQLLRSGDRFFLDQYEIRVSIESSERKPPPEVPGPDSDATVRTPIVTPVAGPSVRAWSDANVQNAAEPNAVDLDPLSVLSSSPRGPSAPARPVELEQQRPVVEEPLPQTPPPYTPPQPVTRPLAPSDPTPLPVNAVIERTQRIAPESRAAVNPPPLQEPTGPTGRKPPANPPPAAGYTSATGRSGAAGRVDRRPAPPQESPPQSVAPPPFQVPPSVEHGIEARAVLPPVNKTINRAMLSSASVPTPPPPPAVMEPLPPQPAPRETRSLSLEQVLSSAGVLPSQMTPELAQELGEVMRIVVQGVMDVLQSRAEIKSQLRMNMTLMKPAENNPLKFSPNVEAALHTLLVERNRGYLPTVRAFHEAFVDIRHHQIAVLQGIRSAFQAMLEQFNPVRLEAEFERHQKRGLLNVGAKGRFRDAYVEEFERLTRDPDESFKRLFGEYFAQAYEEQMDQLKAAARNEGR